MDGIKQKINEVLEVNQWQSYVAGKVDGALAVLAVLNIGKERRIEVLAEALGLSRATERILLMNSIKVLMNKQQ